MANHERLHSSLVFMTKEPTTFPLSYRAQWNRQVTLQAIQPKALLPFDFLCFGYVEPSSAPYISICIFYDCEHWDRFFHKWHITLDGILTCTALSERRRFHQAKELNEIADGSPSHTAQGSPPVRLFVLRLCWAFFTTIHSYIYLSCMAKTGIDFSTSGISQ